mgnify:CR=1 FL=1
MPPEVATLAMFPGQGAIEPHAGEQWRRDPAWSTVAEISEIANVDVSRLLLTAGSEEIVRTDNAQIATFALSLVSFRSYIRDAPIPTHYVGHSLGEFSALVASGVLSVEDGVRVVSARGRAMAAAAELEPGTMAALMGGSGASLSRILEIDGVWLGNVNGPDQIVISGRLEALKRLEEDPSPYGWKKCRLLRVGGAFHSPLMAPATEALRAALEQAEFRDTSHTLYANIDGAPYHGGTVWRNLAERQLTEPVQFVRCIESAAANVSHAIEFQPAGVLRGLVKRISPLLTHSSYSGESW